MRKHEDDESEKKGYAFGRMIECGWVYKWVYKPKASSRVTPVLLPAPSCNDSKFSASSLRSQIRSDLRRFRNAVLFIIRMRQWYMRERMCVVCVV